MRISGELIKIFSSTFKRTKLNKSLLREGEELFSSKLPFKGDYFVSSGKKLANGPKTFAKELKGCNYTEAEINEVMDCLGTQPELYNIFSRELNNITNCNILKDIPVGDLKEIFMRDMKQIAPYLRNNPDKLKSFTGYDKFLSVRSTTNVALSPESLLKEGIYDFDTAAELMKSISKYKTQFYHCAEIPQIIKESTIPNEHLVKIFDSVLSLSDKYSKTDAMQAFAQRILPNINKDSKQLSELIQELAMQNGAKAPFNIEEIESIVKNLDSKWKKDFISHFRNSNRRNINDYLYSLKNEKQAELILQEVTPNIGENGFVRLLNNNVLENEYQIELYKLLKECKIKTPHSSGNGFISKVDRFPELALQDILKNVHNETDFEIVKNMIEKSGIRGEDLYSQSAIIKVLEQNPNKKIKILEKIKKPISFEEVRANETLMQSLNSKNYKAEKPLFQKEIVRYSRKVSLTELQSKLPQGEVALIGDKLMVNNGEKLIELKLTEEDFRELFISEEFTFQGINPDCGLVSTLDTLMATPKGKAYIYSLFESVPNSNAIIVNLHGFKNKIKFPCGMVEVPGQLSSAKGLQILEQAITVAESPWIKAEKGIVTMYDDCVIVGEKSPLNGINPNKVLEYIVGKNNFNTLSLQDLESSNLKNTINKINCSNNSFGILGTRAYSNAETLDKLMCSCHYHGIRFSNTDGSLTLVNPHGTNLSSKVDYYIATSPDIKGHSYYFELI